MPTNPLTAYCQQLQQNLATDAATEHTHRAALEALLEALRDGVDAVNEPQRTACGAPDLAVLRRGMMVGHVEAKDIGISPDQAARTGQLRRYRDALENLILTDYLTFHWYVDGDLRREARLGRLDARDQIQLEPQGPDNVRDLLTDFLSYRPQPIATPEELAQRMARLTHLIREIIVTAIETDRASDLLIGWRKAFAEVLIAGLDQPAQIGQFADMFAQTLAYGLFSARIMHDAASAEPFTRATAQALIPPTNPFLRKFFYQITGPDLEQEPYAGFVNDLMQILAQSDMAAILADFGKRTRREDPTVHFYETFLAAYDPALRAARGVYYTPAPAVSFIVRSVDALLASRFGLPGGLADTSKVTVPNTDPGLRVRGKDKEVRKTTDIHKVLVLDPATGTATFLYTVIDLIRDRFMQSGNAGLWSGYVRDHLLPRVFGFELLMAPYAVAHFKLALQLAAHDLDEPLRGTWAYDFATDERIGIYLTNALEGPHEHTGLPLFTQFLAAESAAADEIKRDLPIMVIVGNPPYSGHSANQGAWIDNLLHGQLPDGSKGTSYYEVDGHRLRERNTKWLQDDYVKFIRFGQWRIAQTGGGVLAYISNNGYLDNPTFRGMRQSLMETFSEIYILDLHGNARKKETSPDGTPDENVFDIMQGVAIGIFIKQPGHKGLAKVYHAELWGSRSHKYRSLQALDINGVNWEELDPHTPFYSFKPKDVEIAKEYEVEHSLPDIIPMNSVGLVTARDHFTIHWSRDSIWETITDFINLPVEEARHKYTLRRDVRDWKVHLAQEDVTASGPDLAKIVPIQYRPFDIRYTYYTGQSRGFICMPRSTTMHHMLSGANIGLISARSNKSDQMNHFFVTSHIMEAKCGESTTQSALFPLYLYPDDQAATLFDDTATSPWPPDPHHGNRVPNLSQGFVEDAAAKLGLPFDPHKTEVGQGDAFGPRDLLAYVYALFHSPTYRARYAEFLKIDFPRVPLTSAPVFFWRLVALGDDLIKLHLLEHPALARPFTSFPIPGSNEVKPRGGYPKYTPPNPDQAIQGRVWINTDQYFDGVPEDAWDFEVGGYQVLDKWLKDRRGRVLTYDDMTHYQRVVVALRETMRLMDEIDAAVPGWPVT